MVIGFQSMRGLLFTLLLVNSAGWCHPTPQESQSPPTDIRPHRLGETFSEWLGFNQLDLGDICGKHTRSDKGMDYKSVCKKLSTMRDTGRGEFYTTDQTGRTFGWEFVDGKLAEYSLDGQWHSSVLGSERIDQNSETTVPESKAQVSNGDELKRCLDAGTSATTCLSQEQLRAEKRLASQKTRQSPTAETYFVDANLDTDIAAVLELDNKGQLPSDVLIQRFAPDGSLTDSQLKHVLERSTTNIRIENPISRASATARTVDDILKVRASKKNYGWMGWIKVVSTDSSVVVSGTWES